MSDPPPTCSKTIMVTKDSQPDGPPVENTWLCGCPTERVISLSTFHLKGAGWASDGYG